MTEGDDDRVPKPPLTEDEAAETDAASAVEEQLPPLPDAQTLCQPCRQIELPERGGCVSAAKAIRMAMDGTSLTSETSRIARSQNQTKSGQGSEQLTATTTEVAEAEIIAGSQPLLVMVCVKNYGATPALVMPTEFTDTRKTKGITLRESLFPLPGSSGKGNVMLVKFVRGSLVWTSGSIGPIVNFETTQACLLNPEQSIQECETTGGFSVEYRFPLGTLNVVANTLWSQLEALAPKLHELPEGGCIPYMVKRDSALGPTLAFEIRGAADALASASSAATSTSKERLVKCAIPGCNAEYAAGLARQHAAYHIRCTPQLVSHLQLPCLLCAAHEQLQYSAHTDSAPGCCAWIEKTGAPRTTCKEVGEVKYSMGWAARSSASMPSTNRLLNCPECPEKPIPFCCSSYNMASHWSKAHTGLTMPQKLLETIAVTDMEATGVTSLGKSMSKNTRKRDAKKRSAEAQASTAKQARVAEEDAASQAALRGRGHRSGTAAHRAQ